MAVHIEEGEVFCVARTSKAVGSGVVIGRAGLTIPITRAVRGGTDADLAGGFATAIPPGTPAGGLARRNRRGLRRDVLSRT